MMRDILLEIGQRGTEKLDPQSVPLAQRPRAAKLAAECRHCGLHQSVIREVVLDEEGITLCAGKDEVVFRYADYNYENIEDTDCLPAVASTWCSGCGVLQHQPHVLHGAPHGGRSVTEKTRQVFIRRHHEDTPFDPTPTRKQRCSERGPDPRRASLH